jgi:pimeloyl-ACP methyl ester carboxylesterase
MPDWGTGSHVYFARGNATRLLVFIHGFGGDPRSTWRGMEKLPFLGHGKLAQTDIVSYGYESRRAHADLSARLFLRFLDDIADYGLDWRSLAAIRAGRRKTSPYDDVLIVAHSLGAAIARRALLDGLSGRRTWPSRTKLLLLAPAHLGARLPGLLFGTSGATGRWLSNLYLWARFRMPVLDDLEVGSAFLTRLAADTAASLTAATGAGVRAAEVVFGERENVVTVGDFVGDPPFTPWPGQTHCTVCRCAKTASTVLRLL